MISLTLPLYLSGLGFDAVHIGFLATAMLLGSAFGTIAVGLIAQHSSGRLVLMGSACLMGVSGLAFLYVHDFRLLMVVAFLGTINPSTGDSSIFQPLEHAQLANTVRKHLRTAIFSWYTFFGVFSAALGALAVGLPTLSAHFVGLEQSAILALPFALYTVVSVVCLVLYCCLPVADIESHGAPQSRKLGVSRKRVWNMTMLYALDAFAGGFTINSILALWLFQRFGLDLATAGAMFFWISTVAAFSILGAPRLAGRIGLINTMVYSHLPASILLAMVPFMPSVNWAIFLLVLRGTIGQLDIPVRVSYLMSIVTPGERAAAASMTAAPRSLMLALSPAIAGMLLSQSDFGWPLVIAGCLKVLYNILLLAAFRDIPAGDVRRENP